MITTQQRLNQFSNAFDTAAKFRCFSNLNNEGLASTKNAMMKALNNWCDRLSVLETFSGSNKFADPFSMIGGQVAEAAAKQGMGVNFSNDLGGVNSTNISTLILGSYYQSYAMSYIAKLEGMTSPKTVYPIQQLRAYNDFGVYHKDDIVFDPRISPYPAAQLTGAQIANHVKDITGATLQDVDFAIPIRINSVKMEIKETGKDEYIPVGFDRPDGYQKGKLYTTVGGATSISIDYAKGKIKVKGATALNNVDAIRFTASYDSTKDDTQAYVPTLYSGNEMLELNSMAHQFTLRQNLEDIVHMNKEYAYNKPIGVASSYAQNTVAQLMNFYVRSLDTNIMRTLVEPYLPYITSITDDQTFNLAGWTSAGNMNLFEGRMQELFAHLDTTMANNTDGRRPTAIIIDSVGAVNLMTNRHFKRQGAGMSSSDGFVGTLYNVPIIKSRVLDWYTKEEYKTLPNGTANPYNIYDKLKANLSFDTAAGEAVSVGFVVHKDPSNKEAAVIVGDYIVPYCTSSMPSNGATIVEHSILCEYATKLMLDKLAIPIVIKVSSHPSFKTPDIAIY